MLLTEEEIWKATGWAIKPTTVDTVELTPQECYEDYLGIIQAVLDKLFLLGKINE